MPGHGAGHGAALRDHGNRRMVQHVSFGGGSECQQRTRRDGPHAFTVGSHHRHAGFGGGPGKLARQFLARIGFFESGAHDDGGANAPGRAIADRLRAVLRGEHDDRGVRRFRQFSHGAVAPQATDLFSSRIDWIDGPGKPGLAQDAQRRAGHLVRVSGQADERDGTRMKERIECMDTCAAHSCRWLLRQRAHQIASLACSAAISAASRPRISRSTS